jgi:hypothetical protein
MHNIVRLFGVKVLDSSGAVSPDMSFGVGTNPEGSIASRNNTWKG